MKLTNTHITKAKSGMTLLELTVVILVLLSLISILFIGARAWKKGSDRAANILNIRNVQQAVRAHANVRGLGEGTTALLAYTEIVAPGKYLNNVTAPNAEITIGASNYLAYVPIAGELYLTPTYVGTTAAADYAPATGVGSMTADW